MTPPHRAYVLTIKAQGNDFAECLRLLEETVWHVKDHGESCALVSSQGVVVHVEHDPTMTAERYHQELEQWALKRRLDKIDGSSK